MLKPAGKILVEDFAFDGIGQAEIDWLLKMARSPTGRALNTPVSGEFVTNLMNSDDAANTGRNDHDSELHSVSEMTMAIESCLVFRDVRRAPYLYRYLIPVLPNTSVAAAFVQSAYLEEMRLGATGAIALIGHRIVATIPMQ